MLDLYFGIPAAVEGRVATLEQPPARKVALRRDARMVRRRYS